MVNSLEIFHIYPNCQSSWSCLWLPLEYCHRRCCQLELLTITERWFSPGRLIPVYLAPVPAQHLGFSWVWLDPAPPQPRQLDQENTRGWPNFVKSVWDLLWDCKLHICHRRGWASQPARVWLEAIRGRPCRVNGPIQEIRRGLSFLAPTCENYVWVTQLEARWQ